MTTHRLLATHLIPDEFRAKAVAHTQATYRKATGKELPHDDYAFIPARLRLPIEREYLIANGDEPSRSAPYVVTEHHAIALDVFSNHTILYKYHIWDEARPKGRAQFQMVAIDDNKSFTLQCFVDAVVIDNAYIDEGDSLPTWINKVTTDQAWLSDEGLAFWSMELLCWPGRRIDHAINFARQALAIESVTDQRAEDMLRDELHRFCRELGSRLELTPEAAAARHDGNLALSCLLFEALESIGPTGKIWADALQNLERQAAQHGWRGWATWFDVDTCIGGSYPWVGRPRTTSPAMCGITEALWKDRVKASWEAPRATLQTIEGHAKLEKNIGAISWAFGAPGEIQDGHAAAPQGIVRAINRAGGLNKDKRRPSEVQLSLGLIDSSETCDNLQAMLNDANALMGGGVAKALLWLTASGCAQPRQTSLGELTRHLNPSLTRLQKRDHEATLADVRALRSLTLILPDNTDIQILDIQAPREYQNKDQQIVWRHMGSFSELIRGAGGVLNGQLILNMDLAMSFAKNQTLELRALVYASSVFNDSKINNRYSPDQAPWRTIEQIAGTLNALSPAAIEAIRGSGSGRRAKSKDSAKVLEALDLLHELRGVCLEQRGKGRNIRYKLIAPKSWQDAYQQWRNRHKLNTP